MAGFRERLCCHRKIVYLIAVLVLAAAPVALFSAASAANEAACWILVGLVGVVQAAVIAVK